MEVVKARLRKGKDDDIRSALMTLPPHYDISDLLRDALRLLLLSTNKEYRLNDIVSPATLENREDMYISERDITYYQLEDNLEKMIEQF